MNLSLIVGSAFALVLFVVLVRALPWPWSIKARKPLACDACMAGWATIGLLVVQHFRHVPWTFNVVMTCAAAGGLTWVILKQWATPPLPPELPPP